MSARTRVNYAAKLVTDHVERILAAIRDDGPDELIAAIEEALALRPPADVNPVVALVTVLAAQIDPTRPVEQRLAWCSGFDPELSAPAQCPELLRLIPTSTRITPVAADERRYARNRARTAARLRTEEAVA